MPIIEENGGKLHLEFFGRAMVIDVENPENAIRQLVRMVKVLELRMETPEGYRAPKASAASVG